MYLNTAILEMELEQRQAKFARDVKHRHEHGELIHAPGKVWRQIRPFRVLFGDRQPSDGVCP